MQIIDIVLFVILALKLIIVILFILLGVELLRCRKQEQTLDISIESLSTPLHNTGLSLVASQLSIGDVAHSSKVEFQKFTVQIFTVQKKWLPLLLKLL